jgi:hypothetical protein
MALPIVRLQRKTVMDIEILEGNNAGVLDYVDQQICRSGPVERGEKQNREC